MSVIGYVRCSTAEQQDSLRAQEDKIKKFAEYKGLKEPEIYVESGISGSIEFQKRPKGKEIWSRLKKGDTLMINKIDRFARNTNDFVNSIEYFKKNGIILITLEPELDLSSSTGLFVANLLSCVAQLEKQMTVERVKATIKQRKKDKLCCGGVPFGYSKTEDKKLIENEKEQNIIKQINEMKKEGLNSKKIADKFNSLNVLNRKWYRTQIDRILSRKCL